MANLRYLMVEALLFSFIVCSIQTALAFSLPSSPSLHENPASIITTSSSSLSAITSSENAGEVVLPPKAISVQPGSSPIEEQDRSNPIDSSCVVLIIGATRGIGSEFATQCLQKGAVVVAAHRATDVPEPIKVLQNKFTDTLHTLYIGDLSSEDGIKNAASVYESTLLPKVGPLTHIIHNAGIYLPGTSFDGTARGPRDAAPMVDKKTLMKTYEINTIAPLLCAQHFVKFIKQRRRPSSAGGDDNDNNSQLLCPVYAFLSSKVGSIDDNNSGGAYAYRSSKSALNNIAKSLSIDLANQEDIRVVLLHPGWVQTDMTNGRGLITATESVHGMIKAIESTNIQTPFRFVDYKANLIPW